MNKAFTLIETLVAIFIFGIIMIGLSTIIVNLYRNYAYVWQQSQAIEEARWGIRTMIKEIREARIGDDGSYPIEKAGDSEFVFYSDVDKDTQVERVRYFLGGGSTNQEIKKCVSYVSGGSCMVTFSDFYEGTLESASVQVSVEGDFGRRIEKAEIFADEIKLGELCNKTGDCTDCPGFWEDTMTFDVTNQAQDNYIQFRADSSWWVNPLCDWQQQNHSMKAQFKLIWSETVSGKEREFKRGVTEPVGLPPRYPEKQEKVIILSRYVENKIEEPEKYVFKYYDRDGQEIADYPARPEKTQLMGVHLIINVNPYRVPDDFELQSMVQLRNLKTEED